MMMMMMMMMIVFFFTIKFRKHWRILGPQVGGQFGAKINKCPTNFEYLGTYCFCYIKINKSQIIL